MKKFLSAFVLVVVIILTSCNDSRNDNLIDEVIPYEAKIKECFYFEAVEPNVAVGMALFNHNGVAPQIHLEYSFDTTNWLHFIPEETVVTIPNEGDRLYIKAVGCNDDFNEEDFYYFFATKSVKIGGNIMFLLNGNSPTTEFDPQRNSNAPFASLFMNMTTLTDASDLILPAKLLTYSCYACMFLDCSSLRSAPDLPATTLFGRCYSDMFNGCSSLKSAPDLPATILANECYSGMFSGCALLTDAPDLPATTLADRCYWHMFSGCALLTDAPDLPATTLADECYFAMFSGCVSLQRIKINFTQWNDSVNSTSGWLRNVNPYGTFTCPSALDVSTRNDTHVPEDWTIVNE